MEVFCSNFNFYSQDNITLSQIFQDMPDSDEIYTTSTDEVLYRLFLTTNERNQQQTIFHLIHDTEKNMLHGDVFIGVSGLSVLNLASVTPFSRIFVIDAGLRAKIFWEGMQEVIPKCESNVHAFQEIVNYIHKNQNTLFFDQAQLPSIEKQASDAIELLKKEVESGESFLASPSRFAHIKTVFKTHNFVFKRLDFSNFNAIQYISRKLQEAQLVIGGIYLSNVREYIEEEVVEDGEDPLADFRCSISHLVEAGSPKMIIIDTKPRSVHLKRSDPLSLHHRLIKRIPRSTEDLEEVLPVSPSQYTPFAYADSQLEAYSKRNLMEN